MIESKGVYGSFESVKSTVALEGNSAGVRDTTITEALSRADIHINLTLEDRGVDKPTAEPWPEALVLAATYYAIADALQAIFDNTEDVNNKVVYYMDQSTKILDKYISIQQTKNGPNTASQGVSSFGGIVPTDNGRL